MSREAALEAALGVPFVGGNHLDILRNGVEIFPAMLEAIDEAEESVDFLTFVYWGGDIAVRFADAFASAARRGANVRVLLDGVGAVDIDDALVERMTEAGVELRWLRPARRWIAPWELTHRTHRKVLVCDGRVGFTGGVGIAEEWEGDARSPDEWRETHFRVRGPGVRGLEAAFLGNWLEGDPEGGGGPGPVPDLPDAGDMRVQVIRSRAGVAWSDVITLVRTLFELATERVRISTPYLVPDDATLNALCSLAERGVSVEILVPGPHIDHRVAKVAAEGCYERLLEAGVALFEYQPTLIHQKVMTVDDSLVMLGSANLNHRSLLQDDEVQVVVSDEGFTCEIHRMLDEDFAAGEPVERGGWERRGVLRRVGEGIVRLLRWQL